MNAKQFGTEPKDYMTLIVELLKGASNKQLRHIYNFLTTYLREKEEITNNK